MFCAPRQAFASSFTSPPKAMPRCFTSGDFFEFDAAEERLAQRCISDYVYCLRCKAARPAAERSEATREDSSCVWVSLNRERMSRRCKVPLNTLSLVGLRITRSPMLLMSQTPWRFGFPRACLVTGSPVDMRTTQKALSNLLSRGMSSTWCRSLRWTRPKKSSINLPALD